MEYIEKTLTAIITHNTSSITFTDDFITDNSIIDVYFSSDDIVPTNQEQIGNRLIISIEPKNYDVSIAVHITNDDTINYADELERLSDTVEEHTNAISDLAFDIDTLENKVDGLNASNINYDEHSTIYSAMGDIDTLETTSKNLVGAINELKESGGGGSEIYDNTERVIGKFFNKNLYRKVLNGNITPNSSSTEIGLPNIDIVKFDGYMKVPSNNKVYNGYSSSTAYFNLHFNYNGNNYRLYHPTQNEGATYQIIIEYTKVGE